MPSSILDTILDSRKARRSEERSHVLQLTGGRRQRPLNSFFSNSGLICELKRSSPSRGVINQEESLGDILKDYIRGGAHRMSVLTESSRFCGSCDDLFTLARSHPNYAFLRKDFLYCTDDIRESYLLGADAVLLIAEMLDPDTLGKLTAEARRAGLGVLTEAHSEQQAQKVMDAEVLPDALGINSRDLGSFRVNPLIPYMCAPRFIPQIPVVLESGVTHASEAFQAGNSGLHGMLIGSRLMETPHVMRTALVSSFASQFSLGSSSAPSLITKLFARFRSPKPLVKICGITTLADAELCAREGADMLGFILARSKRSIDPSSLKDFAHLDILKIAVVCDPDEAQLSLLDDLHKGEIIDGVQFHGSEPPDMLDRFPGSALKAVTVTRTHDIHDHPYGPFVLYDLPKGGQHCYTDEQLMQLDRRLIAGGITPDTLSHVLDTASPLLVDIASGVESSPGRKDPKKVRELFSLLEHRYG